MIWIKCQLNVGNKRLYIICFPTDQKLTVTVVMQNKFRKKKSDHKNVSNLKHFKSGEKSVIRRSANQRKRASGTQVQRQSTTTFATRIYARWSPLSCFPCLHEATVRFFTLEITLPQQVPKEPKETVIFSVVHAFVFCFLNYHYYF